ncbi:Alkaline phosphatase synthesis sensor protein PhoR [compost metagenome]
MSGGKYVRDTRRTSFIFSAGCLLLILGYAAAVTYLEGFNPAVGRFTLIFIVAMLAAGAVWNWMLRRQTARFIGNAHEMVDRAIHGKEPLAPFDETSLSSLEHKLLRYIEISQASSRNLEAEKNTVKELISDISHQTKTPLANIMLYSQLLAETPDLSGDTLLLLRQIEVQSEKLEWLITSLIKLSRLETGLITLQGEVRPILETITNALSHIQSQAVHKRISIEIACDPSIRASHDYKWTPEALLNLLENAVKYTGEGGSIRITAQSNEMFTRIDVTDNGIGIPKEELEHIFKRFYRGQGARDYEGIGLGLYLTRKMITLQGGYITAASEAGRGTRLSIYLPQL